MAYNSFSAGSRTSNVQDLKLVRVTRSTVSDFSSGNVIFNLANTALSFSDSALVPGTVYHYRIETGNSACSSSADVCGQSDSIIISAVGVPSAPTSLASALVAGSPGAYDLSWAAPSDTGQGNGSPSVVEVLTGYDVLQDGTLKASQAGTTYRLTGLVLGQSYVISVRAKNQAGQGLLLTSLTRKGVGYPSKPLFFTATVSAVDGPLKIRLNWATPSDTGQGNGNSDTQLTGYKVLLASANEVKVGSAWTSDFATSTTPLEVACANTAACSTTTVLTFGAARAKPYVMRVYAQNPVGYGALAEIWEQAVALPSAPLSLSALVTSPNQIKLSWMLPVDTGVGDQSRPLVSVYVQRSFGSANLDACTVNCTSCTGSCITSQIGACCSDTLASTTTSITLTNVPAAETRYYVRVKGGNDVGVGAASGVANEQVMMSSLTLVHSQVSLRANGMDLLGMCGILSAVTFSLSTYLFTSSGPFAFVSRKLTIRVSISRVCRSHQHLRHLRHHSQPSWPWIFCGLSLPTLVSALVRQTAGRL